MKKSFLTSVLLLSLLLFSVLFLSSCDDVDLSDGWVPSGMQQASGKDLPYRMFVPTQWKVGTSDGATTAYSEDASVSFTQVDYEDQLTEEGKKPALADYYAAYVPYLKESVQELTFVTENEDLLIDGEYTAKKYVFSGNVSGKELKFMQVVFYQGDTLYLFTFTSSAENYGVYEEHVNKILNNLIFNEKSGS